MDFTAENVALWNAIIQLGIISGALLLANFFVTKISIVRKSLIPTSALAGFILLLLRSTNVLVMDSNLLQMITYHGIALGFIALSLRVNRGQSNSSGLTGAKTGSLIVGAYLLQGIAGLMVTIALGYTIMPNLFKASGILLPMGFGQGAGQANNVGGAYEALGFEGGRSFALSIAAAGYLVACVVGIIIINLLVRKGKYKHARHEYSDFGSATVNDFQDENEIPISESIDKFSVQIALVLITYLCAFLLTWGITSTLNTYAPGVAELVNSILWGFNFIIASVVAILLKTVIKGLQKAKIMTRQYQNNYLLSRISGLAFDLMIVAGIASIELSDLSGLWLPFILLCIAGISLTYFYLAIVCKKLYPDYYYESMMAMYGMLTGTISSGVLLLRELDPNFKTPAANDLLIGSTFAIVFAVPVLILIGLAPKSDTMAIVTVLLCAVYLAILLLFMYRAGRRKLKPKNKQ